MKWMHYHTYMYPLPCSAYKIIIYFKNIILHSGTCVEWSLHKQGLAGHLPVVSSQTIFMCKKSNHNQIAIVPLKKKTLFFSPTSDHYIQVLP